MSCVKMSSDSELTMCGLPSADDTGLYCGLSTEVECDDCHLLTVLWQRDGFWRAFQTADRLIRAANGLRPPMEIESAGEFVFTEV